MELQQLPLQVLQVMMQVPQENASAYVELQQLLQVLQVPQEQHHPLDDLHHSLRGFSRIDLNRYLYLRKKQYHSLKKSMYSAASPPRFRRRALHHSFRLRCLLHLLL